MRILFVATELPKASGITTFVENVSAELRAAGHTVVVHGLDEEGTVGVGVERRVEDFDIVHLHGLWKPGLHRIARRARRLVWSPHGMLQLWALKNKGWKKFAALALYQWWDLRKADLIHVTAESEVADVRRLGLKNDLVVAPLGIRVPDRTVVSDTLVRSARTLLFVSRVQRKKGLPNLLVAWANVPPEMRDGWTLRIVGPDEDSHTAELMAQCERLGVSYVNQDGKLHSSTSTQDFNLTRPQVEFLGPKYGAELDTEYRSADLFVLPTHSENFGSVVIEALAHGVPVITTKAAPWEDLTTHRCGRWVEDSVEALELAISEMMAMSDEERAEMGARGRRLVEEKYTWSVVTRKMKEAYENVLRQ